LAFYAILSAILARGHGPPLVLTYLYIVCCILGLGLVVYSYSSGCIRLWV